MELMGGIMIMLALLTLLFGAVWLSLPILIIGLWRRLERLSRQLERIEIRMADVERPFANQTRIVTTQTATMSNADTQGGVDGTTDR